MDELNKACANTFVETLGIRFTDFSDQKLTGTIHLQKKHLQPFGTVHGGVYISFAETLAGAGSSLLLDPTNKVALGVEVNTQHISSAKTGQLSGTAILQYQGITKHIWDVKITDEAGKLISISRVTNSIKDVKPEREGD